MGSAVFAAGAKIERGTRASARASFRCQIASTRSMPTLLNINNYHYRRGGADVAYLNQSDLFREHGWKVANFAMRHPDNLPSEWSGYFADEIELGHEYGAWPPRPRRRASYSRKR